MNKVYHKSEATGEVMDSVWFSNKYLEVAEKIALHISQLDELKGRLEYLHKTADDNGDPSYLLDEATNQLGKALAATLNYSTEYREEAEETEDKEGDA